MRAFTLLELVTVIVVIGVIAAIAVPRMGAAQSAARSRSAMANASAVQRAIDYFSADHGFSPAHTTSGGLVTPQQMVARLLGRTEEDGTVYADGSFGPYLDSWAVNPMTTCTWVRFDGTTTPQGCAFRLDTSTLRLSADHKADGTPCGRPAHAASLRSSANALITAAPAKVTAVDGQLGVGGVTPIN